MKSVIRLSKPEKSPLPKNILSDGRYPQKDSGTGCNTFESSPEALSEETVLNSEDWNLFNNSPKSESLFLSQAGNINRDFEHLSLANGKYETIGVQTDLVFPNENGHRIIEHVHLLRGLLCARQYDIESRCKKKLNFYDSPEPYSGKKEKAIKRPANTRYRRQSKILHPQSKTNIEVIDLVSSPEAKYSRLMSPSKPNSSRGAQALRFALRHSNQESEVSNSMKTLADFVCEECINLDVYVQNHWTGSLIELCVDTLLRAAHAESNQFSRVLLKVCQRLLDEVVQENKPAMGSRLESYSNVIIKFSDNKAVAVGIVDFILSALTKFQKHFVNKKCSLLETVSRIENLFHLLRILVTVLQNLEKTTSDVGKLPVLQTSTDNSVLNLWRTHWKSSRDGPVDRKPSLPINQSWTGRLTRAEEIVKFSVERVPLMSPLLLTALKSIRTIHIRDSS